MATEESLEVFERNAFEQKMNEQGKNRRWTQHFPPLKQGEGMTSPEQQHPQQVSEHDQNDRNPEEAASSDEEYEDASEDHPYNNFMSSDEDKGGDMGNSWVADFSNDMEEKESEEANGGAAQGNEESRTQVGCDGVAGKVGGTKGGVEKDLSGENNTASSESPEQDQGEYTMKPPVSRMDSNPGWEATFQEYPQSWIDGWNTMETKLREKTDEVTALKDKMKKVEKTARNLAQDRSRLEKDLTDANRDKHAYQKAYLREQEMHRKLVKKVNLSIGIGLAAQIVGGLVYTLVQVQKKK